MVTNKQGKLVTISPKGFVKIEGVEGWIKLGEKIKPNYLRAGLVEYNISNLNGKNLLTFCRGIKDEPSDEPEEEFVSGNKIEKPIFQNKEDYWKERSKLDELKHREIFGEFCVREGIRIIEIFNEMSKDEDKIKPTFKNIFENAKIIELCVRGMSREEFAETKEIVNKPEVIEVEEEPTEFEDY